MFAAGNARAFHPQRAGVPPFSPRWLSRAALLAALSIAFGCGAAGESSAAASRQSPILPLDTGTVFIETAAGTHAVSVEIAETSNQREIGLMERAELPGDEGMIFLSYEERDSTEGFWMFRTRIPLDIAYLDRDGRIVAIRTMPPCTSPYGAYCPTYPPGARYWGALEVNAGYFEARGVRVGDRVTLRRLGRMLTPADSS
jgi:uncharacterized protein